MNDWLSGIEASIAKYEGRHSFRTKDAERMARVIREQSELIKLLTKKYSDAMVLHWADAELSEAFHNLSPDAKEVIDDLAE